MYFKVRSKAWEDLHIFFHPDYTVGFGVSPNQLLSQVADFTASGEFHPALKTFCSIVCFYYTHYSKKRKEKYIKQLFDFSIDYFCKPT